MRVLGSGAMEVRVLRYIYVVLAAWLATPALSAAQSDTEERIRRIQQGLAPPVLVQGETPAMQPLVARMTELKVPGVSIAVIHQGRIEWARGFGITRTEGPPVTEQTLFQAASISKPVFALAVLHLVDAGKLNLDADVNDYLKDWKLPDNDLTRQSKVTLRGDPLAFRRTDGAWIRRLCRRRENSRHHADTRRHAASEQRGRPRGHPAWITLPIFGRRLCARAADPDRRDGDPAAETPARLGTRTARHDTQHFSAALARRAAFRSGHAIPRRWQCDSGRPACLS